jgi:hypothetical protein
MRPILGKVICIAFLLTVVFLFWNWSTVYRRRPADVHNSIDHGRNVLKSAVPDWKRFDWTDFIANSAGG